MNDTCELTMKIERQKAKDLRKSRWWQTKIQKTACYYCQTPLDAVTATMDHLVPISRGGKTTKGNLVPACRECNRRKESLTPVEWVEYVERLARS